jgi:hypothetical protein
MIREQSNVEVGNDAGFEAGSQGEEPDDTKSLAWQRGWAETQG